LLCGALTVGIFAAQGKIPGLPGNLTAHVTITPLSTLEADNYLLEALPTGTPDPARRQIGARLLTRTSGTSTAIGTATGPTPTTRASGTLTFQNVGASNAHVDPGVLTGADGIQITFYQSLTVSPSTNATLIGYAINPGAAGNISALDLDGRCCAPNVFVKNMAPFSGGHDAAPNSVIQQSDIEAAARPLITPLEQNTEHALQAQITPNERVVDQSVPPCTPTITPSVPAGTTAKAVTVSVQVTCHEEVYDSAAAQSMTTTLLRSRAEHDPTLTAPYTLQGQILTSVLSATVVTAGGQVSLEMEARGIWVYRLADQEQQQIKRALIALSKEHALSVLHHERGVAAATISISNGTIMPPNAGDIILIIQAPPGAQASPTSTAGTRPTVPPTGPGLTPTPVNGLGGS
jgi:hypothetical protein